METITLKVTKSVGYSGKGGRKSYIARITGSDDTYILRREFVATEATDRAAMFKIRRKGKGSWTEAAAVECGLYERQDRGDRTYHIVWADNEQIAQQEIAGDQAVDMAVRMDEGATCEEARLATMPSEIDRSAADVE